MSVIDITKGLRELILQMARREDVHSVSCHFRDAELWKGLLKEQVNRAKQQEKLPEDAFFLCGPDGGIPGIAKLYPWHEEVQEENRFDGNSLEEKIGGQIHIPYEGVCGADFFVYPTWRKLHNEAWERDNAELDWATPMNHCNHLLLNGDYGVPVCATRTGPIDGWWIYSSTAPYKDCNPLHRKR